ncbi:CHAD domain-containing protein [Paraburkholderia bengalensis]|uniref:CHAD domain-containing protein n=1 Tax=Paraburkholderia bengalensis TaxID=2747562 RepID=A0ABU8IQN8_9BURK
MLKKAVKRAIGDRTSRHTSFHEVRIAGKKLQYVLEFFSPILQRDHQAVIESLASVQDVRGRLNDLVTNEALLREHAFQLWPEIDMLQVAWATCADDSLASTVSNGSATVKPSEHLIPIKHEHRAGGGAAIISSRYSDET